MTVGQKEARVLRKTRIVDNAVGVSSSLLNLLPAVLGVLYIRTFDVSVVEGDA